MRNYLLILISVCVLISIPLSAQEKGDRLVISEIYADPENPANNWIEIYNPADKVLILERFRPSNVRAINVLPKGEYQIEGGGYLILCSNKEQFVNTWGDEIRVQEVKALPTFNEGGFVFIATKDRIEAQTDAVRYGTPSFSDHVSDFFGSEVISFSKQGKSLQRQVDSSAEKLTISNFTESAPSPGRASN